MTNRTKPSLPGEFLTIAAMVFNSFAVTLLIKADFGISAISSVPYVFSIAFPVLTNGIWNALIQCLWLILTMIAIKKIKPGYIFSFVLAFLFGFMLDFWAGLMAPWSMALSMRLVYFVTGFFAMTVGISCFILCGTPILPFDTVVRAFTMEKGLGLKKARTGFDLINLTLSLLVSLLFIGRPVGVGIGTLVSALLMGTVASRVTQWMREHISVQLKMKWLGRLV